ncbi:MAG: hypothetical protein KJ600_00400 [Nanoarchaeota archaeon]|nr:hypothetical protein [Nanoarchaeota archaeon]
MVKVDCFALVAGLVLTVGGIVLILISIFSVWFLAIPGLVLFILGIVILLTLKQQEYVEPTKERTKKNKKQIRR